VTSALLGAFNYVFRYEVSPDENSKSVQLQYNKCSFSAVFSGFQSEMFKLIGIHIVK
jgi:hypothetical protein